MRELSSRKVKPVKDYIVVERKKKRRNVQSAYNQSMAVGEQSCEDESSSINDTFHCAGSTVSYQFIPVSYG